MDILMVLGIGTATVIGMFSPRTVAAALALGVVLGGGYSWWVFVGGIVAFLGDVVALYMGEGHKR